MKMSIVLTIGIIFILVIGIVILNQMRTSNITIEDLVRIDYQDTFTQESDDYLVYFWQEGCVYCEEVEPNVLEFIQNTDSPFFLVDMQEPNNQSAWYDWESHHEEHDIKIGKVVDGEEQLNDEIPLEKYTENTDIRWEIEVTEYDEIIVTHNTPFANSEPATADAIEITGTPIIIHVKDGEVVTYANGSEQVKAMLEENK
ncbi:hypothetical protein [Paraliobacillus sediminis]|uniref:hypothetical protein n=1 Tax=Paraliobacillus sediminis TaxID=1885916 RepID=UPI000E3C2518|nr:hypothetical protein [Paraliobacillus sediminis]